MANRRDLDGKRDLAKYFGIHGDMRTPFKMLLKELEGEGHIARTRKTLRRTAALPAVTALDIPSDADPDNLHAYPANWNDDEGEKPRVIVEVGEHARVVPAPGDRILARISTGDGPLPQYTAKPMKILDKPRRGQIGIVRIDDGGARLVPVDRKVKEMRIDGGDLGGARDGDLVEVTTKVSGRLMIPKAKVEAVIGNPHSEGAVSMIAIHNLEIPYRFPASVLKEAEAAQDATLKGREDWRHIPLITIDPPDAKDHDDAVHAEPDTARDNPGGYIVHVAIADVASYVKPGSALDREALARGNSVYFPDRVVPMLPERISNDLCSLRAREDRPALAVRMVIGADGRKRSHTFHRILMRSTAKLSYQQAQSAIGGRPDEDTETLVKPVLAPLYAAYEMTVRARTERQPLDLDLPERKILLKGDGTVDRVITPERLEAHRLIEEFMILANVAAAETLERARVPLIYRVHDEPGMEKVVALREFLATLDIPFQKGGILKPELFNRVLARVKGRDAEQLVNEIVLRTQAQAEYSAENYGHFGLNLRRYAHFTSPIRRYADLIVHRGLIRALKLGNDGLPDSADQKTLAEISAQISATERRAMLAERETADRLIAHFLVDRVGASFDGRISGVTRAGLFVKLRDTGADGFVPARTIGDEYFRYDDKGHAMVGSRSGETYRLGDPVTVKLVEAAPVAGALRFELVSEGRRGRPVPRHQDRQQTYRARGRQRKRR